MRSGNGSLGCSGSGDSLGGILNRLARLSWPFSSNSSSVCGPSSSTSARCSWRFHRLSSCRLAYSRRKASWGLLLAQAQTPEGQFQAEGVEFDTFETCGDGGVLRQLLVGDAQPDAGYEQKAQQAIDEEGDQQGADSAFQSFGHGSLSFSVLSGALGMARPQGSDRDSRRFRAFDGYSCCHGTKVQWLTGGRPMRRQARCIEALRTAQRSKGTLRLTLPRIRRRCSGLNGRSSIDPAHSGNSSAPARSISAPNGLARVLGAGALKRIRTTSRVRSSQRRRGRIASR